MNPSHPNKKRKRNDSGYDDDADMAYEHAIVGASIHSIKQVIMDITDDKTDQVSDTLFSSLVSESDTDETHRYVKTQLDSEGYVVLQNRVQIPDEIRDNFVNLADKKASPIFNHNEKSKTNDRKRVQVNVNRKRKYIDAFMKSIETPLIKMFPHLEINDWVIIKSKPGCKDQAAHTDYPPSEDMTDESKIPVNIMVALQNDTYVNVWPKSQRLICKDLVDDNGISQWDEMSRAQYKSYRAIKMIKIKMNKGDLLLFRGDLVHSGSGYSETNYRLHCFMDHSYRTPNRTWLIHTHASEHMRRLINVD